MGPCAGPPFSTLQMHDRRVRRRLGQPVHSHLTGSGPACGAGDKLHARSPHYGQCALADELKLDKPWREHIHALRLRSVNDAAARRERGVALGGPGQLPGGGGGDVRCSRTWCPALRRRRPSCVLLSVTLAKVRVHSSRAIATPFYFTEDLARENVLVSARSPCDMNVRRGVGRGEDRRRVQAQGLALLSVATVLATVVRARHWRHPSWRLHRLLDLPAFPADVQRAAQRAQCAACCRRARCSTATRCCSTWPRGPPGALAASRGANMAAVRSVRQLAAA